MCGTMRRPCRISFPQLERTLRDQELVRSMDERGHVNFRGALPDGPVEHSFHAAADGQLGGIMKVYRDWQISGDTRVAASAFIRWPSAASISASARGTPIIAAALFEPHHNTYDIEFWGAGWDVHQHLSGRAFRHGADGAAQLASRQTRASMRSWQRSARLHGRAPFQRRVLPAEGAVRRPARHLVRQIRCARR